MKCSNCGAEFDEKLPACPFCGMINIAGAQVEYENDMEQIQEELKDLAKAPVTTLKKELGKQMKIFLITIIVFLTIVVIFVGFFFVYDKLYFRSYSDNVDPKEQLLWEHENFPLMDEYYEQENYDAILDLQMGEKDKFYSIYNWEHADFLYMYTDYEYAMYSRECLRRGEELSIHAAYDTVYCVMKFVFFTDESEYAEEEWERILEWQEEMEEFMYGELKFTKEEAEEFAEQIRCEYGIEIGTCNKLTKKIYKRFGVS